MKIEKGAWGASFVPYFRANSVVLWQVRIEDLKKQIDLMSYQISRKDDQISQLNEVTQQQSVHIQNLIQENRKSNTKLLPAITENKKPWWRFW